MIERALVTGGAGFIGANLVDRLVDDGAEVLVVDDLSTGKLERLADARREGHVQVHQMDVRDRALHDVAARFRPSALYHLAAQIDVRRSVADPVLDADINVIGTVNVLEAAARSGVGQVVFASSGGTIFGDADKRPTPETAARRPGSPYGVSKLVAEEYLRYYHAERGVNSVALGFANVYGPRQDPHGEAGVVAIFTRSLLAGEPPVIYGDGTSTRDYVFVEDVTDACVRDPARAKRALGWEPWTSLQEGLAATVEWFAVNRE
jgi:UDP-glucose 4-epimerase